MAPTAPIHPTWLERWQRFSAGALRAFHVYASWLVSISWRRFIVLSVLLLISVAILKTLPPFHWTVTETIEDTPTHLPRPPRAPKAPVSPKAPVAKVEKPATPASGRSEGVDINIQIDEKGIRITPRSKTGEPAASPLFGRGVMRMPLSSIWMLMSRPSPLPLADLAGFSIFTAGAFGAAGASGGFGARGARGRWVGASSMVSVTVQWKGGRVFRMATQISSSTDSTMKRRQLMPTSQLA